MLAALTLPIPLPPKGAGLSAAVKASFSAVKEKLVSKGGSEPVQLARANLSRECHARFVFYALRKLKWLKVVKVDIASLHSNPSGDLLIRVTG